MKASFDITLAPCVNVQLEVANPMRLSDKEVEQLVQLAIEKIKSESCDTLCADNLEGIKLYRKDTKEDPLPSPVRILPHAGAVMAEALSALRELSQSGYIPFASPCPSATEKALKLSVKEAVSQLECATRIHDILYGDD